MVIPSGSSSLHDSTLDSLVGLGLSPKLDVACLTCCLQHGLTVLEHFLLVHKQGRGGKLLNLHFQKSVGQARYYSLIVHENF